MSPPGRRLRMLVTVVLGVLLCAKGSPLSRRGENLKGHLIQSCPRSVTRLLRHYSPSLPHTHKYLQKSSRTLASIGDKIAPIIGETVVSDRGSVADGGNREKVELRIYNIDKYGLSRLGSKALRKEYNAIWHVAIGAFGSEFWFDHQINEENLEGIEVRFGYAPTEVINLGETSKSHEELQEYLEELRSNYNVETYDCFHHNCHNFAQDVSMWLTGNSIPQWCLDHGGDALSNLPAKDAEAIRWASNKIAKIMMVSWGRYNKERFDRRFQNQKNFPAQP